MPPNSNMPPPPSPLLQEPSVRHPHEYRRTMTERFWRKVVKTETCWLWTGAHLPAGYGMIGMPGGGPNVLTHRFSYELHYGPIPDGLLVCHKCDNPPCVRPDHLYAGTQQDNVSDMIAKWQQRRGTSPQPARITYLTALNAKSPHYYIPDDRHYR